MLIRNHKPGITRNIGAARRLIDWMGEESLKTQGSKMQRALEGVLGTIAEIFGTNAVMGYPIRDYSEEEALALVHQQLEGGKGIDVLSFHKGDAEAIAFCHSDGWGSLSLRCQDCFYEYSLSPEGHRLVQCVNPDREAEALAWLNMELTVELNMFFRVDPELLRESAATEPLKRVRAVGKQVA